MHRMSRPRLPPLLVPHSRHPLRRPHPHAHPRPLPRLRLPPPRPRAFPDSYSSHPSRPRHRRHRHRQSLQRRLPRTNSPRPRPLQHPLRSEEMQRSMGRDQQLCPVRHDGDVRTGLLVRRETRQGWPGVRRGCDGGLLGMFDRHVEFADVHPTVYRPR